MTDVKQTYEVKQASIYGTIDIVSAYVAKNPVQSSDLPALIKSVHEALRGLSAHLTGPSVERPAVAIEKSITEDFLICLEDGKKFKSLKRHLRSKYDMTPEQYRGKWGLPVDYPMVAPSYAKKRSELAKEIGLGRSRK